MTLRYVVPVLMLAFLAACGSGGGGGSDAPEQVRELPLQNVLKNTTAYIPVQCYTQTEDADGTVLNSCYTCHQEGREPNFVDDAELQLDYVMASAALTNPWRNMFEDRSARVAGISDDDIRSYVRESNYRDADGSIILARRLDDVPAKWDYDQDGEWSGYLPDCYFDFDDAGFDHDPDGGYTGWRAFAYYPFPATYWPTNGSAGDVAIRLGEVFRKSESGKFDLRTYVVNLAIVEALIKRRDVAIEPVDENRFGVDLDKDGVLGTASIVKYDWAPIEGRMMHYVGQARVALEAGEIHLAAGLYPEGTEFLQSLRYLDVAGDGTVVMAPRMKELRHARKYGWRTYATLREIAFDEVKDKDDFPDRTRLFNGNVETGMVNPDSGWSFQGFIEDRAGDLRPQTFEETAYCMGCHGGGLGATTDSTFAFERKLDGNNFQRGWYHWTQRGLAGLNEPKVEITSAGVHYEYTYYLMYTRSGDEFRANAELRAKFFNPDGSLKSDAFDALHDDIAVALLPSARRALDLNKAYRTIVQDQDYDQGRDVLLGSPDKVYDELEEDQVTGVEKETGVRAYAGSYRPTQSTDTPDPALGVFEQSVLGVGMGGPDGANYEVGWNGIIRKSTYSPGIEGVTFTFPPRLTLPTREITPLRNIPVCYDCHRLRSPIVDAHRRTTLAPNFPDTTTTPAEAAVLTRLTTDAGRDVGGRWSPDGTTIAFVSDRSGSDQIWLMDSDGGNPRRLTDGPAKHAWPEWRSDGQRLVYWAHDATTDIQSIKTIAADGTDEVTVLTSAESLETPRWRPDGSVIAYGAVTAGNWDVWVTTPDGSETWRLTTHADMESSPYWSPDGTRLAYKLAPSGQYSLTVENVMTFEKGFDEPTVHAWVGPEAIQASAWSPDGTQIAYTCEVISGASGADRVSYACVISTVDLQGGKVVATDSVVLSKGMTLGDRGAVFSPDGNKVAFWAWDKNYRATLWLYDKTSDSVRALTTAGFDTDPRWSPDGTRLAFESTRGGSADVWVIRLD